MSYTSKDKFNLICKKLNIKEYLDAGFKGQGITIATVETIKEVGSQDHGYKVYNTIKTYAPNAKVISFNDEFGISATGDQNTPETINFPKFVDWCIKNKVNIVTSSLGWDADKEVEKQAIQKLYDNGIIFCNSAGNDGNNDILGNGNSASNIDMGVVSVSGLALDMNEKETWADYDYGTAIDVVTYGENVPIYVEKYKMWYSISGTSFATPLIVSMIADVLSAEFDIKSDTIMKFIKTYSIPFKHKDINYNELILPSLENVKTWNESVLKYDLNDINQAIDYLSLKGIMNSPEFWKENYDKKVCLQYVDDLIKQFASKIKELS